MKILTCVFFTFTLLSQDLSELNFVSNAKSWKKDCAKTYGRLELQSDYGKDVKKTVIEISTQIDELNLEQLLDKFAHFRMEMAVKYQHADANLYGKIRESSKVYETTLPKNTRYEYYGEMVLDLIDEYGGSDLSNRTIIDQKICLVCSLHEDSGMASIRHSDSHSIATFIEEADREFELAKKAPRDDFIKHLSKVHFYLNAAMKYQRGSSSISEYVVRSFSLSRGLKLGPIGDIFPDLETLIKNDLEDFTQNYLSYYQDPIFI